VEGRQDRYNRICVENMTCTSRYACTWRIRMGQSANTNAAQLLDVQISASVEIKSPCQPGNWLAARSGKTGGEQNNAAVCSSLEAFRPS